MPKPRGSATPSRAKKRATTIGGITRRELLRRGGIAGGLLAVQEALSAEAAQIPDSKYRRMTKAEVAKLGKNAQLNSALQQFHLKLNDDGCMMGEDPFMEWCSPEMRKG